MKLDILGTLDNQEQEIKLKLVKDGDGSIWVQAYNIKQNSSVGILGFHPTGVIIRGCCPSAYEMYGFKVNKKGEVLVVSEKECKK